MTATNKLEIRSAIISKIAGLIKRSFITRASDDKNAFQTAQISYLDKVADTEIIWPYGMFGNVPVDSLCVTFSVGAHEEDRVTIASRSHKRIRRNLKPGEIGIGNFDTQSEIFFDADGNIIINAKSKLNITVVGDATITANKLIIDNDADITGNVNLGVGGAPIARVGDSVLVGGDAGVITSGSSNHTAS